jgi:CDP-glucose 4,6-dehydratase
MGKDYSSRMEIPLGQRLHELPGPLLLTGHTGFKGTWMTFLLEHLNIPVVGFSLPAEKDSLFERGKRTGAIPEAFSDIRNYEALEQFIDKHQPSTIVHMAAQPLVLKSYESPRETFDVNVMGTVNILEIAFKKDFVKAIIVVTTDKVYRNEDSGRAFIENDPLEGKDPYSASKVGTESVVAAWQQIAKVSGGPKLVSVRAGNVIGGGDFAENRLIPDLIKNHLNRKILVIRNPDSVRPWQHVLDPLHGYILALEFLLSGGSLKSVNFGPVGENITVRVLIEKSIELLGGTEKVGVRYENVHLNSDLESQSLNLDSQLALTVLDFEPLWDQEFAIFKTFEWWNRVLSGKISACSAIKSDVAEYILSVQENRIRFQ